MSSHVKQSQCDFSRDVFEDSMLKAKTRGLRGQGQGSSRPRPQNFVLEVDASSRGPHPWAFYRAMLHRERCHVVCLSITLKFSALLPPLVLVYELLYLWYWGLYLLTIGLLKNSTSYGQILKPKPRPHIVEAKAKGLRGQGQGSSRPRPQNFVLEVEASPRGPHPCIF